MTYGGEGATATILSSVFYTSYAYRMLYKGVKWIRHVWEGEGHKETKEPCISDYIDWILWDWIPQRPGQSFAEDSGNPLVKLPLPLRKQQMNHCQPFTLFGGTKVISSCWVSFMSFNVLIWVVFNAWIKQSCQGKRGQSWGKVDNKAHKYS